MLRRVPIRFLCSSVGNGEIVHCKIFRFQFDENNGNLENYRHSSVYATGYSKNYFKYDILRIIAGFLIGFQAELINYTCALRSAFWRY